MSSAVLLTTVLSAFAVVVVGCGSSSAKTESNTTPAVSTPAAGAPSTTTPAATETASSTPASTSAASGLSGTWSGEYGGGYRGTFTLTWQQSGSNLTGSITLSTPAATVPIHGTLAGSTIRFGTVGSLAITYSGTVSGKSMSGTYGVQGSTGGTWSANKTS